MADLEKTIKGLEHCGNGIKCETCPYRDENDPDEYSTSCNDLLCRDALELLKWQAGTIKGLKDSLKETLDVVANQLNVVRCKDCKHYKDGKCWNVMRRYGLHDNFFCADGREKDGD